MKDNFTVVLLSKPTCILVYYHAGYLCQNMFCLEWVLNFQIKRFRCQRDWEALF